MLNGLMFEVVTVMWLFGLFDVVCGTLKSASIDFSFCFFFAKKRFSTVLMVDFCSE